MASASLIFWRMRARLEGLGQRPAFLLSQETALLRAAAADLLFDRIECGNVLERLACDRCRAGCGEFVEVAPHVHPTECELDLTVVSKLWACDVAIDPQDA